MTTPVEPVPNSQGSNGAAFDEFAGDYDAALNRGIGLSGESKDYFIQGRIGWLRRCMVKCGAVATGGKVLDYGCGTGASLGELRAALGARVVMGVDISTAELEIARRNNPWARAMLPDEVPADFTADVAYSNGTFHHIPPAQRSGALGLIYSRLKPGGYFALWENNPWNPGTRWVMSRIPFDRDAITLSAIEARRLVRAAGFEVVRTDFLFIFPRFLAVLRGMEGFLSRIPMGAQYMVLCRRPGI